jgi:hypothetical protein
MQISTDGYGMACAQSGRYKISNMIMLNVSSIFVLRAIFTWSLVFFDPKKAFDMVDRSMLRTMLEILG